jgi:hypothetical protein
MQNKIASLLEAMSIALIAVGLLQNKWEPFVLSMVCLIISLYLAWKGDKMR